MYIDFFTYIHILTSEPNYTNIMGVSHQRNDMQSHQHSVLKNRQTLPAAFATCCLFVVYVDCLGHYCCLLFCLLNCETNVTNVIMTTLFCSG